MSVGGPAFDAAGGATGGGGPAAAAVADRCLFLPPPPRSPRRNRLADRGAVAVWGAANAFAVTYADPPALNPDDETAPPPGGGELSARTGPAAVVPDRPRVPAWADATGDDLLPRAGTDAATDGLGAGPGVGPDPAAGGADGGPPRPAPARPTFRPPTGPDF